MIFQFYSIVIQGEFHLWMKLHDTVLIIIIIITLYFI